MTSIGVIGCGKQAPKHISGLKAAGIADIVVADIDPSRAADLAGQYSDGSVRAHQSVESLFADTAIDAVSICTPTPSHAANIRQAIYNGKHYLCEKPLCETVEEAEELAAMTKDAGLTGMVGYIYRFAPAFKIAREILSGTEKTGVSPVLGRLTTALFRIGGRGSHTAWKHQKASGGGAMNEMMVHMLDLAQFLFGPMRNAEMLGQALHFPTREIGGELIEADAEDWVLARMKAEPGPDILVQADFITPAFTQYVEIQGENGSFMGSIQNDMPNFVYCSEAAGGYDAGKTVLDIAPTNMFEAQMAAFLKNVRGAQVSDADDIAGSVTLMKLQRELWKS